MSKNKLFTKEEKEAIEIVLGMGLAIYNSKEDSLVNKWGDITVTSKSWEDKEYKSLSSALVQFLKRDNEP